jgi:S1-C subfamily serine protease
MHNRGRFLSLSDVKIKSGMSGSPIVDASGAAIGVISTGDASGAESVNPSLMDCLPPWPTPRSRGFGIAVFDLC